MLAVVMVIMIILRAGDTTGALAEIRNPLFSEYVTNAKRYTAC